jgi:hypothetical protein
MLKLMQVFFECEPVTTGASTGVGRGGGTTGAGL